VGPNSTSPGYSSWPKYILGHITYLLTYILVTAIFLSMFQEKIRKSPFSFTSVCQSAYPQVRTFKL